MTEPARKYTRSLSVVVFTTVLAVLCTRAVSLVNVPGEPDFKNWVMQDFRDSVFYAEVCFLAGGNPYDTETYRATYPVLQRFSPYSPHFLLFHLPFGLLPYSLSQVLFFFSSVALTVFLAFLTLKMCDRRPNLASVLVLATLVLASRPGYQNLLVGQTALEMVIAVYLAFYFSRTSPWVSAVGVIGAIQKATFGLPLVVFMLWKNDSRPLRWGLGTAAVAIVIVMARLAWAVDGLSSVLQSMWAGVHGAGASLTADPVLSYARIDAVALVGRVIGRRPGTLVAVAIFIIFTGVACAAIKRVGRQATGRATDRYCLGVASIAILLGTYHQPYSALVLVLPLMALVFNCWAPTQITSSLRVRLILIGLLLIPFVNYAATSTILSLVEPSKGLWLFVTSLNGGALLAAFLLYVFLAFRHHRPSSVVTKCPVREVRSRIGQCEQAAVSLRRPF